MLVQAPLMILRSCSTVMLLIRVPDRAGYCVDRQRVPGHYKAEDCIMTLDEDRTEIEQIAVSWQDVPEIEPEAMLTRLGKMLEHLDSRSPC